MDAVLDEIRNQANSKTSSDMISQPSQTTYARPSNVCPHRPAGIPNKGHSGAARVVQEATTGAKEEIASLEADVSQLQSDKAQLQTERDDCEARLLALQSDLLATQDECRTLLQQQQIVENQQKVATGHLVSARNEVCAVATNESL